MTKREKDRRVEARRRAAFRHPFLTFKEYRSLKRDVALTRRGL